MGTWDSFPSGNGPKKPLSKKELRKRQALYEQGSAIVGHVRSLEEQEAEKEAQHAQDILNSLL